MRVIKSARISPTSLFPPFQITAWLSLTSNGLTISREDVSPYLQLSMYVKSFSWMYTVSAKGVCVTIWVVKNCKDVPMGHEIFVCLNQRIRAWNFEWLAYFLLYTVRILPLHHFHFYFILSPSSVNCSAQWGKTQFFLLDSNSLWDNLSGFSNSVRQSSLQQKWCVYHILKWIWIYVSAALWNLPIIIHPLLPKNHVFRNKKDYFRHEALLRIAAFVMMLLSRMGHFRPTFQS